MVSILAIVAVLCLVGAATHQTPVAHGSGIAIACTDNVGAGCIGFASSTPQFLTSGNATTTAITLRTTTAQVFALNFAVNASSSSSVIRWQYQYSYTGISTDWYTASVGTANGAATASSTQSWTPGVAGISTLNTTVTGVDAPYTRVLVSAVGANSSLYLEAVVQNVTGN